MAVNFGEKAMELVRKPPVSALANAALSGISHAAVLTESWVAAVQDQMGWSNATRPMSPEAIELLVSHPEAYRLASDAGFGPERSEAIWSTLEDRGITA